MNAYQQALTLRREMGQQNQAAEPLAGLARVGLAQSNMERALAAVADVFQQLESGSLDGTDEPVRVYLTCYQVFVIAHDPRANAVLENGYRFLQQRAARIANSSIRQTFLEQVPAHRALLAAWQATNSPAQEGHKE